MTKIRNIFNNGKKNGGKLGVVNVNSYNVCPDTILADAAGSAAVLTRSQMNLYDFFKVDDVNGSTDQFHLPDAAEVGESFTVYALTAFEMHTETETDTINDTASFGFNTVAGSMYVCTKVTSTAWIVIPWANDGTAEVLTINVAV